MTDVRVVAYLLIYLFIYLFKEEEEVTKSLNTLRACDLCLLFYSILFMAFDSLSGIRIKDAVFLVDLFLHFRYHLFDSHFRE